MTPECKLADYYILAVRMGTGGAQIEHKAAH